MAHPAFRKQQQIFRDKVEFLAQQFRGQSRLAQILGVDRSRVSRWLKSELPDPGNRAKVDALEYVFSRLTTFLHPKTAEDWLFGIDASLGNRRPIDLLRQGRVSEVIAALEQFEAGSYA